MFSKTKNSGVKNSINDQTISLEQIYTTLLNRVDNNCLQYYDEIILLQWFLNEEHFSPFLLLVIFFSVLLDKFIVSAVIF